MQIWQIFLSNIPRFVHAHIHGLWNFWTWILQYTFQQYNVWKRNFLKILFHKVNNKGDLALSDIITMATCLLFCLEVLMCSVYNLSFYTQIFG